MKIFKRSHTKGYEKEKKGKNVEGSLATKKNYVSCSLDGGWRNTFQREDDRHGQRNLPWLSTKNKQKINIENNIGVDFIFRRCWEVCEKKESGTALGYVLFTEVFQLLSSCQSFVRAVSQLSPYSCIYLTIGSSYFSFTISKPYEKTANLKFTILSRIFPNWFQITNRCTC